MVGMVSLVVYGDVQMCMVVHGGVWSVVVYSGVRSVVTAHG